MFARTLRRRDFARLMGRVMAGGALLPLPWIARLSRAAGPAAKWECTNDQCEPFIYDPEIGVPDFDIPPGIPFEALPEDWVCPICGNAKWEFQPLE